MPEVANVGGLHGLAVERGRLLAYRLFDIGLEVNLEAAEQLLGNQPGKVRAQLRREGGAAVSFSSPPLEVPLGKRSLTLSKLGRTLEVEAIAHLYDHGAAAILYEIPILPGTTLADLVPVCDEVYDSADLDQAARGEAQVVLGMVKGAVKEGQVWKGIETFTVVFVEKFDRPVTASALRGAPELARLLVGESSTKPLAQEQREDVLRHALSYFEDDLVVIDWNSAFVLEPSGSRDIPMLLEVATAQLLELRYYDALMDKELGLIYDRFEQVREEWSTVLRSPYDELAREVLKRWIGLTEFTERVDNAVKVVGDFYLARVYKASVTRFQIPAWQHSVDQKLALIAQVYGLLKDELHSRRSLILEVIVVFLIAFEIVMAFVH